MSGSGAILEAIQVAVDVTQTRQLIMRIYWSDITLSYTVGLMEFRTPCSESEIIMLTK